MNLRLLNFFCVTKIPMLFSFTLAIGLVLVTAPASAYSWPSFQNQAVQEIVVSALPREARETLLLIKQGGPYPYKRDGVVFRNFEKRLPKKQRGYYHEYTVKTPGARNRGARRIVCGQISECYYTSDHYETFKLIRE